LKKERVIGHNEMTLKRSGRKGKKGGKVEIGGVILGVKMKYRVG